MGWMLNIINPNKNRKSFNYHDGIRLDWDFCQSSFIFCSTNPEKFSAPFISRLERVDLEEYTDLDLVKILYKNAPDINFSDNVELDIASVCRGTPREIVKISEKIKQFCEVKKQNTFNSENWGELKSRANINYLGLNSHEIKYLLTLKEHGELTLTMLAAKLMLDRTTVQRDIEKFLQQKSLILINIKRLLSEAGYNTVNILKGQTS
jgi:holliday junction DNA helicase RuvB